MRTSYAEMREYIRRGTQIDITFNKIVNCGSGTDDDDVITLIGLSAYYRRCTVLGMRQKQMKNLGPETKPNDALTLLQA